MGSACTFLYPGMLATVWTRMTTEGVASIAICWRCPTQEFRKQESEASEEMFNIGDSWDMFSKVSQRFSKVSKGHVFTILFNVS